MLRLSLILVVLLAYNAVYGLPQGYSFSYNTGTGGFHEQQGSAGGPASGKYGFSGAGGSNLAVSFSVGGGSGGGGSGGSGSYSHNINPQGSYSYNYKLNDQSKSESRSADGKVKGAFSYKGSDGQEKSITYTADERGFLPEGAHIPKAPPV